MVGLYRDLHSVPSLATVARLRLDVDHNEMIMRSENPGELREALQKAVEVIRIWHGLKIKDAEAEAQMWKIYWEQSPEMKIIREALER